VFCSYNVDWFNLTRFSTTNNLAKLLQGLAICLTLCYKIQLWQLNYPFTGYSSSLCVIHVRVIMPCFNASMFSCHQQFIFLQSLICFLDANIASEFEYCHCSSTYIVVAVWLLQLAPQGQRVLPPPTSQSKMILSSTTG